MKTILIAFSVLLLSGCKNSDEPDYAEQTGTVEVYDGDIEYFLPNQEKDKFYNVQVEIISQKSMSYSKGLCTNKLTFKPVKISISIDNDTISALCTFKASNAYGVESEETALVSLNKSFKVLNEHEDFMNKLIDAGMTKEAAKAKADSLYHL